MHKISRRRLLASIVTGSALLLTGMVGTRAESASSRSAIQGQIFTADEKGSSISAVNLANGEVTTVATSISPHNVQISADGRLLLAVGPAAARAAGHSHADQPGRLLILPADNVQAAPLADIPVGRHPAHVVIDADGRLAFVTNSGDDAVAVVDLGRKQVVRTISTGSYPHGLRISPDGREILVANVKDGSVSVLSVDALRETARISVGKVPVQVGYTPDGRRAYVSLRDENAVAVLDVLNRKKIAQIAVGRGPIQVFATPEGREVYVANEGSSADPGETVSIIDVASGAVVDTLTTGKGAHGVVISADGVRAFVSNILDDTVSVIDVAGRRVIDTIKVGDGPNGITFRRATVRSGSRVGARARTGGLAVVSGKVIRS